MIGFEATAEDLDVVLRRNFLRLVTEEQTSFWSLAERLLPTIDQARVERAALKHSMELEQQTQAAQAELEVQLVEAGVLRGAGGLVGDLEEGLAQAQGGTEQLVGMSLAVKYLPGAHPSQIS